MQAKYIPDPTKFPIFRAVITRGIPETRLFGVEQMKGFVDLLQKCLNAGMVTFWHAGNVDDLLPDKELWSMQDTHLDAVPSVPPFTAIWTESYGREEDGVEWRYANFWAGYRDDDGVSAYTAYNLAMSGQRLQLAPLSFRFEFAPDGVLSTSGLTPLIEYEGITEEYKSAVEARLLASLVSFMFSHCKNVDLVERLPSRQVQRAARKQGRPIIRHHEVLVRASHNVTRGANSGVTSDHPTRALHIARGHFATYTEDAPLFGKYTGTFWRPAHVRGSAEAGTVYKDYKVRP